MVKTITFNELRELKDMLPNGSIRQIATDLNMNEETVRNYFGGQNFKDGRSAGVHMEAGPDGGIVVLDDMTIFKKALNILGLEDFPATLTEEDKEA